MSEPMCPFCGEFMTAKSSFYDKWSGKHSSHAKCWACGAQGPIVKGSTSYAAINKAMKHALLRPKQRPIRFPALDLYPVVWLEDIDKKDTLAAFPKFTKDKSVVGFYTARHESITAARDEYGRRWRAWAAKPNERERREMPWVQA